MITSFTDEYQSVQVIAGVMDLLNMRIRPFVRIDLLQTIFAQALSSGCFPSFSFFCEKSYITCLD